MENSQNRWRVIDLAGPRPLGAALAAVACLTLAAAVAAPPALAQGNAPPPAGAAPVTAPTAPAANESSPPPPPANPPVKAPLRKPNHAVPVSLEILQEKLARYPDNPYLLNEVGNQLLLHGRRVDAETHFARAVKIDPNSAAAWNNLGVVRLALDKNTEAATAYKKALKIQPNYALAWYNLGVALDRMDRYDEALQAYERAFVLDPGLLEVKKNPQIVANSKLAAVMSQTYLDRGGTVVFPLQSSYPRE
ncbi:MAG TPA: tetratricopeptide repeat protein [Dongiaceae bacterium]|nr:tetratricopeptide repeat protein [Dongiaceae bacterium]